VALFVRPFCSRSSRVLVDSDSGRILWVVQQSAVTKSSLSNPQSETTTAINYVALQASGSDRSVPPSERKRRQDDFMDQKLGNNIDTLSTISLNSGLSSSSALCVYIQTSLSIGHAVAAPCGSDHKNLRPLVFNETTMRIQIQNSDSGDNAFCLSSHSDSVNASRKIRGCQ